jgi:excisionase family DNA binding protein
VKFRLCPSCNRKYRGVECPCGATPPPPAELPERVAARCAHKEPEIAPQPAQNELEVDDPLTVITPKELACILKCSPPMPYILAKRGVLKHYRVCGMIRFKRAEIEAFLSSCHISSEKIS